MSSLILGSPCSKRIGDAIGDSNSRFVVSFLFQYRFCAFGGTDGSGGALMHSPVDLAVKRRQAGGVDPWTVDIFPCIEMIFAWCNRDAASRVWAAVRDQVPPAANDLRPAGANCPDQTGDVKMACVVILKHTFPDVRDRRYLPVDSNVPPAGSPPSPRTEHMQFHRHLCHCLMPFMGGFQPGSFIDDENAFHEFYKSCSFLLSSRLCCAIVLSVYHANERGQP